MNAQDNIKAAQIVYDLVHREQPNSTISDFDLLCIIYVGNSRLRIKEYKNFLIYLINYYQLTDITDETNLTFEKFSRKLEILIQESKEEKNKHRKKCKKGRKRYF